MQATGRGYMERGIVALGRQAAKLPGIRSVVARHEAIKARTHKVVRWTVAKMVWLVALPATMPFRMVDGLLTTSAVGHLIQFAKEAGPWPRFVDNWIASAWHRRKQLKEQKRQEERASPVVGALAGLHQQAGTLRAREAEATGALSRIRDIVYHLADPATSDAERQQAARAAYSSIQQETEKLRSVGGEQFEQGLATIGEYLQQVTGVPQFARATAEAGH